MPFSVTATIEGHPWDLWGLSRLFDGSDPSHTLVKAAEPEGMPTFDTRDPAAVARFRARGYNAFSTLTSDELVWDEAKGKVDLSSLIPVAMTTLAWMNGVAIFLDPNYTAATLHALTYASEDSAGHNLQVNWTPNKSSTSLGVQVEHAPFARDVLLLAQKNGAVRFVLDAIALPRWWATMYLIYETISESVGGVQKLDKMGFVSAKDLKDFRNAANNSRALDEGIRHAKKPQPGTFIPLDHAYRIINTLAIRWMQSLISS